MYLSKISLADPQAWFKRKRKIRDDLFREHQMIWDLFESSPNQSRDFLYRREDVPGALPFYYLLSARNPTYDGSDLDLQTKVFEPVLEQGAKLSFSLRANAVVTRKVSDKSKKRQRRDIVEAKVDECKQQFPRPEERPSPAQIRHDAVDSWLLRQGETNGFTIREFFVENHQFHKVRKPNDPNERRFSSLDVRGQLVVKEPGMFREVLSNGLGRSKAFGCGLMLVKRP